MAVYINYLLTLLCIFVLVTVTVSDRHSENEPVDQPTEEECEKVVTHVETFVKNNTGYLKEQGRMLMDSAKGYKPGANTKVTELCLGIFLESSEPMNSIKLQGCVNIQQPDVMTMSFSDFNPVKCSHHLQDRIKEIFYKLKNLTNIFCKPPTCTCPTCAKSPTTPTQLTTQTTRTTSNDPRVSPCQARQYTCPTCATSSTTPIQLTTQTTRTTRTTPSLSTSTDSVSIEPNSDKIQEACSETQGLPNEAVVIIGVTSFLAGVLVVLLFLCLIHIKRTSQLCFRKSVKPPEAMTSDRATKKVLAKHMLSDRTDPPTQTNVLYFKNESEKKDLDPNTPEDEYAEIDNPNTSQDNYTGLKTSEVRSPVNDAPSTEEHVYIGLQFDDKTDNKNPSGESVKTDGVLRGTDKTGSELFDRTRDSNISGHDYFVLQNENFRTSHQPDARVSDDMNTINEEKNERPENTYFELEKGPDR